MKGIVKWFLEFPHLKGQHQADRARFFGVARACSRSHPVVSVLHTEHTDFQRAEAADRSLCAASAPTFGRAPRLGDRAERVRMEPPTGVYEKNTPPENDTRWNTTAMAETAGQPDRQTAGQPDSRTAGLGSRAYVSPLRRSLFKDSNAAFGRRLQ